MLLVNTMHVAHVLKYNKGEVPKIANVPISPPLSNTLTFQVQYKLKQNCIIKFVNVYF